MKGFQYLGVGMSSHDSRSTTTKNAANSIVGKTTPNPNAPDTCWGHAMGKSSRDLSRG